jgi:purine-binding chemotaxis protein CheW
MENARASRTRGRVEQRDSRQYLTFALAGEEYGVDILRVQEVKGWTPVTRIPRLPAFVSGVLDLRGQIVPIIDMRARFDLERIDYGPTTVIIVVNVGTADSARSVGIVVDAVSDVIDVENEAVKPPPAFGTTLDSAFIRGLANVGSKMVMLLDADRLLSEQELAGLAGATA